MQAFPEWTNRVPLVLGAGAPLALILVVGAVWYWFSPEYTDVGYRPEQPIPYSHKLHVGEFGMDCRYCHSAVEISPVANVPPTQVCMNCHKLVGRDRPTLEPLRASVKSKMPVSWVRVHNLPDYAYFEHRAHVNAGVGCVSCHGRIDQMEVVKQVEPLSMGWCLECHRNPAPSLRPVSEVTNMRWVPGEDHEEWAARWIDEHDIRPPEDCSGCHR